MNSSETHSGSDLPAMLITLHPEILIRIMSLIFTPTPKQPTSINFRILYTCRRLHNIALPQSVHTYTVTYVRGPERQSLNPSNRSRLLRFFRYITVTKPWLAAHVRSIHFNEDPGNVYRYQRQIWPWKRGLLFDECVGRRLVDETRIDGEVPEDLEPWIASKDEWERDLAGGREDAELALLIASCPNLESLGLGYFKRSHSGLYRVLYTALQNNCRFLQRLRVFRQDIASKLVTNFWSPVVGLVFRLPLMRVFKGCQIEPTPSNSVLKTIPVRSSSVEDVHLIQSWMTTETVKLICGSCKALKLFEYTQGEFDMDSIEQQIFASDISGALVSHAQTLEYVRLNLSEDYDNEWQILLEVDQLQRIPIGIVLKELKKN